MLMAETLQRPRIGRPQTKAKEKPGSYVGCRVPDWLKTELENAATAAGRSLSTEVQIRLVESFRLATALADGQRIGQELLYGRDGAVLMQLISRIVSAEPRTFGDGWTRDPTAFALAEQRIAYALAQLRPAGDPGPMPEDQVRGPVNRFLEVATKIGEEAL
jgi:hypothetical protein